MALIEIDHVSKTYGTRDGGVVANDDVTLHVEEGRSEEHTSELQSQY